MKDVIERLERLLGETTEFDGHERDLKALLSYTKQCEEALREIADEKPPSESMKGPLAVRIAKELTRRIEIAQKALSLIQHGE